MAAVSTTPANVHQQGKCQLAQAPVFGEQMDASDACYFVDGKWYKLDSNANHDSSTTIGVVLVSAVLDGYGQIVLEGPMDIGGTLTNRMAYIAGTTPGDIHPVADFAGFTSAWQYHIGYALAADILYVKPYKTGASI